MTIEQTDVVDFVACGEKGGDVLLVISDHLPWDEGEDDHILLLQEKLKAYMDFIEHGQLYDEYPDVRGGPIVIQLANKYPLSEKAMWFLGIAADKIKEIGARLTVKYPSKGVED